MGHRPDVKFGDPKLNAFLFTVWSAKPDPWCRLAAVDAWLSLIELLSLRSRDDCDCCPGSVNLFNIKFYIVISRIVFVFVQKFFYYVIRHSRDVLYLLYLARFHLLPLNQDQNIYRAYDREMFFIGKLLFSEPTRRLMILYEKRITIWNYMKKGYNMSYNMLYLTIY